MRLRLAPLALCLLAAACSKAPTATVDPCDRVTCDLGQDCIDGNCVDRPTDGGSGCLSSKECAFIPDRHVCDLGSGECVQCVKDAECPGGTCVGQVCKDSKCKVNTDCTTTTAPVCRTSDGVCLQCLQNEDCPTDSICSATLCKPASIACTRDAECAAADSARPLCKGGAGGGVCVACRGRSDCPTQQDCQDDVCKAFPCTMEADCTAYPGRPHCDPTGKLCLGCLGDGDCGTGQICTAGSCQDKPGCAHDVDCIGDPRGALCDAASGACVFCLTTADCPSGETCLNDRSACGPTPCTTQTDCPPAFVCTDSACAKGPACTDDNSCTFDPRATHCGPDGFCVTCLSALDCPDGQRCDSGLCVAPSDCAADTDCQAGYVCLNKLCSACRSDDDCPRGTCKEGQCQDRPTCKADTDCAAGICAAGSCQACASDLDCRPGLWCQSGSCVEDATCSDDAGCTALRTCQSGACARQACSDDSREPDSAIARARPIRATGIVAGTLCANDDDFMVFGALSGAGLDARLASGPPGAVLTLHWYQPGTGTLKTIVPVNGALHVPALPPAMLGRYYLQVHSTGPQGVYTVSTTVASGGGACADPFEPNDSRMAPTTLPPGVLLSGLTLCGDQDWYLVNTEVGKTVAAYAFFTGSASVDMYDASGNNVNAVSDVTTYRGGGRVVTASDPTHLPGQYLLKVSAPKGGASAYELYVAVGNDTGCAGSLPLLAAGATRGRVQGDSLSGGLNLPPGACDAEGPDALYTVQIGAESRLDVAVAADYDARLSLHAASCGNEQSCAPFSDGRGTMSVGRLAPGSYVVSVSGGADAAGPFDMAARVLPPISQPANDICSGAQALDVSSGKAQAAGSTAGAEADQSPSCAALVPDVYYAFTLTAAARTIIDVQSDEPIYTDLLDAASCTTETACLPPARSQHLDLTLAAGDHALAIGSASGAAAAFTVSVVVPPPVANDTCASAPGLAVPGSASGDTTYAADDLSFPQASGCTGYFTTGNDAFYSVNLAAGQKLTATLKPGATYDAALYVIGGCAAPSCLAGSDSAFAGGTETVTFTAPAAGVYHVVVDGAEGGGTFTLSTK